VNVPTGGIDLDLAAAQGAEQVHLRGTQRPGLVFEPGKLPVEVRNEQKSWIIGHVPESGHDRGSAGIKERARQPEHAVSGNLAQRSAAGAEHDQVRRQFETIDFLSRETLFIAESQKRIERLIVAQHPVRGEMDYGFVLGDSPDGCLAGPVAGQDARGAFRRLPRDLRNLTAGAGQGR
jgi:hypothetical protein